VTLSVHDLVFFLLPGCDQQLAALPLSPLTAKEAPPFPFPFFPAPGSVALLFFPWSPETRLTLFSPSSAIRKGYGILPFHRALKDLPHGPIIPTPLRKKATRRPLTPLLLVSGSGLSPDTDPPDPFFQERAEAALFSLRLTFIRFFLPIPGLPLGPPLLPCGLSRSPSCVVPLTQSYPCPFLPCGLLLDGPFFFFSWETCVGKSRLFPPAALRLSFLAPTDVR